MIAHQNSELADLANLTTMMLDKYHNIIGCDHEKTTSLEKIVEHIVNYYEGVIGCMPGNVYWLDKNGNAVGCNKNVLSMFGFKSIKEFKGLSFEEMGRLGNWTAEAIQSFKEDTLEVVHTGKAKENVEEPPIPHSDGRLIYFLTTRVPLFDHTGAVIGVVGISIDITERKRMEEELRVAKEKAEAASKAKTEFLAVASHELRVPLTGILGLANFLAAEELNREEEKEFIKHILDSGSHLLSVINDILDFAKLEADKFEINSAPIDLKALVEESAGMLTAPAKSKGLDLYVVYEPNTPHKIMGDSRALRQVLANLIGNAVKFTHHGHIAVKVSCLKQAAAFAQLKIVVEDTGIGIPVDKINTIFERFEQVHSAYVRSESQNGTGLGLSITKKLIELMNGEIAVTSTMGKGTTFYCTVEFPLQNEAIVDQPWAPYAANVPVLVVDDTPRADIICKHIGSSQCNTTSGEKALHDLYAAQQLGHPYHVIVIDQQLKTATAVGLIHEIQKQKSLYQPMSILLVPKASMQDKQSAKEAGFFDIVVKPVQPIAFQAVLTSAWERWTELGDRKNSPQLKSVTIKALLVEDHKVVQIVHKKMLRQLGCDVEIADTGNKALSMVSNNGYDILFVDIGLPDISGFEVIKVLRHGGDAMRKIPIIALTGYSTEDEKQACLAAGADEVVVKPATLQVLQDVIARYAI